MPYHWDKTLNAAPDKSGAFSMAQGNDALAVLRLWPHRSLPRRGFAAFLAITIVLLSLPLFSLLGTAALWGLLPFLALAVFGVWRAVERNYADGRITEVLTLWTDTVTLVRQQHGKPDQSWRANPYWAQLNLHETSGRVANYLTLKGEGREVELGAFLSPDERKDLKAELDSVFALLPASVRP